MSLWEDKDWTPMLLKEIAEPFDSKEYYFEMKFDGIRAIIYASPEYFKIFNRHHKDITYLYPELEEIRQFVKKKTVFDGEIIALENGVVSFSKLQERAHLKNKDKIRNSLKNNPVLFVCFDILYENKDLINLSLEERKKLLDKYKDSDYFLKSKYLENKGIKLFESIKKLNIEGIVGKKKNSLYEINTRSDNWLKIKNIKESEFLIGGYIEKENSYTISLILGEYREGFFCYVGKVVLGKKRNLYPKIKKERIIKNSPFIDFSEDNVNYLKPTIKITVNYIEKTQNNHLRQPFIK